MSLQRSRSISMISILGLAALACRLGGTPIATSLPSIAPPLEAATPTAAPVDTPAAEPLVVTHTDSEFRIYALDGTHVETRSAEGLSWARPNTAQVVGQDIYFVAEGAGQGSAVVRRVTSSEMIDLEFTRSKDPSETVSFTIAADQSRIAWAHTSWAGGPPFSQLWIAGIDGSAPLLVTQTDTADDIAEFFVLEPVRWLEDGDLVFAWQVSGIGGYILFFGWSSLFRYDVATGAITPLVGMAPDVTAPCWSDLTDDGVEAVGACGESRAVVERNTATGVETALPVLPDQGQAGAAAYAPQNGRLAYAIARGDPDDEAGQLVLVPSRGEGPTVIASQAPGAFETLRWIDQERMVAGYWQGDATFVDAVAVDGSRRTVGPGRLVGLMRP